MRSKLSTSDVPSFPCPTWTEPTILSSIHVSFVDKSIHDELVHKASARSSGGQRRANAASQPVISVSGEAIFEGSELIKKRPSGETSYCQFAIRSAAMRV